MAWVRYDDQFQGNPKVTAVIAEDPGALALHVLANTWTNTQKRLGFVPVHQPAILLCDRELGAKWAALLVKTGLWHDDFGQSCADCTEEYAELPRDSPGYVIHNAREYRAPARERTSPGTPADLSEKRRAAGSKGGRASAARREQDKQSERANQANGVSKTGKLLDAGVSPEPVPEPVVASNEATVPPPAGANESRRRRAAKAAETKSETNAGDVVGAYVDAAEAAGHPRPGETLRARVGKQARKLLAAPDADADAVLEAAREMGRRGWHDLEVQMQRSSAERNTGQNGRDSPAQVASKEQLEAEWKGL